MAKPPLDPDYEPLLRHLLEELGGTIDDLEAVRRSLKAMGNEKDLAYPDGLLGNRLVTLRKSERDLRRFLED